MGYKPILRKAYGSIPHIPGSRADKSDKIITPGQVKIITEKPRKGDRIIVQEKLDGSCVAVHKQDGHLIIVNRAGWNCESSPHEQHRIFAYWVKCNKDRFLNSLVDGQRIVGEWLLMRHGIKYDLDHEYFVAFDIIVEDKRIPYDQFKEKCAIGNFITPHIHSDGPAFSYEKINEALKQSYHGGECPEGVVFRVENAGEVDFLAKYVRPDHVCGKYFSDDNPQWNLIKGQCFAISMHGECQRCQNTY